jgi:hypothetical protein
MRKLMEKKFEAIASILTMAAFAGVAMLLNGGQLAYFGTRDLNSMTDVSSIERPGQFVAQNVWRGKTSQIPIEAGLGAISLDDLIQQMYRNMFAPVGARRPVPDGRGRRTVPLREGSSDLPHYVHVVARHRDGTVFLDYWGHNLRVNAGINWQYNQMAGTTAAVCTYIALTNTAITPAATDTALSGEITTNGLARALGTPTHTSNATSYTLANTFTATGTQAAQAAGMFNASSSGTLCFENTFTQASLVSGDTLTVTWTITF